jgi:hypothetical protein
MLSFYPGVNRCLLFGLRPGHTISSQDPSTGKTGSAEKCRDQRGSWQAAKSEPAATVSDAAGSVFRNASRGVEIPE